MTMVPITHAIQNLNLPSNITQNLVTGLQTGISQFISYIANSVLHLISSIPALAAQILILIFSVFYFAKDGDKVVQYIKDVIPRSDNDFIWKYSIVPRMC